MTEMIGGQPVVDWQFDIVLAVLSPIEWLPLTVDTEYLTNDVFGVFNMFPHVEISPIENGGMGNIPVRTTFITWTHAVDADPPNHDFQNVQIECTNSHRLYHWYLPQPLFDGTGINDPGGRNGLADFVICFDDGNWQKGALVWLNDLYPSNPNEPIDAWGGQVHFTPDGDIFPESNPYNSPVEISIGDSSWNFPNFNFGPEAAIYCNVLIKCIWTDVDGSDTGVHGNTDVMTYGW
jgi:hypothetical protein